MRGSLSLLLAVLCGYGAALAATPAGEEALTLGVLSAPPEGTEASALPPDATPAWGAVWLERADVERDGAEPDWSGPDARIAGVEAVGMAPVLVLEDAAGSAAPDPAALEGWLAFARAATRRYATRARVVQVYGRLRVGAEAAAGYAFVLKATALAVRAEARGAGREILVAQAAVGAGDLAREGALWAEDVAAYIDIVPVLLDPGATDVAARMAEWSHALAEHPPAAKLWAWVEGPQDGPQPRAGDAVATALRALAGGAVAALVGSSSPELASWVQGAHALLADQAPAPVGALALERGEVLGRFVRASDLSSLVFFRVEPTATSRLVLDAPAAQNAVLVDPRTAEPRWLPIGLAPGGRVVEVPGAELPLALRFERGPLGPLPDLPREELETRATRELTAEEIIARYQEVQRLQDDRLERWMARGRIDFHFRFAAGGPTIDVGIVSNYFWERGAPLEWEEVEYFFNGNRVPWKKFPELPLIQPEKVLTLPLDLTLDRSYSYRLVGRENVGEREAYVLEFQPAAEDAPRNLYRGRVWIDVRDFVRLQALLLQTELEPPVLSNEERDHYAPQPGADVPLWMLSRVDGQQTWNTVGRTFVVRRELVFESLRVNPPAEEFTRERETARASDRRMLADTEQGVRYLERQPDGTRTVKTEIDTSRLFGAAGAFYDRSTDGVVPLAGVNYLDWDFLDRGIQVNALFAGVLGFFTASKPDLFGTHMDLTADLGLSALKFEDEAFVDGVKIDAASVEERPQAFNLRLGIPVGPFWKLNAIGGVTYYEYSQDSEAAAALAAINAGQPVALEAVLPADHAAWSGELQVEFNRRGYTVRGGAEWATRSDWGPWGIYDPTCACFGQLVPGPGGPTFEPLAEPEFPERFARYRLTGFKEWEFSAVYKLRAEVNLFDGSDLDRFSRYGFTQFGSDRLSGFAGSGVRFDRGAIGRVSYAFNVLEAVRLGAELESAWVEERWDPAGNRRFTGAGIFGNVPGPWRTVFAVSYGRAIDSEIDELDGSDEFQLLVFKLF